MPKTPKPEPADVSLDLDQGTFNRLAEYNAETVLLTQEAEEFAEKMARHYFAAKEDAKTAKENYEAALDGIRRVIRERHHGMDELRRGQKMLPFTAAPDAQADGKAAINASFPAKATLPAEIADTPLSDLEISDHTADMLRTGGLATVGHLIAYAAAGKNLRDIIGVTATASKAIGEALDAFLAKRESFPHPDDDDRAEHLVTGPPADRGAWPQAPGTPLTPPPAKKRRTKATAGAQA